MSVFSKGLTAINVKTAHYLEVTQRKTYIDTLTQESNQIKMEVANQAYVKWQNGQISLPDDMTAKLQMIKDKQNEIELKKQEIERLEEEEQRILGSGTKQNVVYCTSCGSANGAGNRFCEKCGNALVQM